MSFPARRNPPVAASAIEPMDFDLIVIGAGPAGCSAAAEAARLGLKVALIEKERLPRHKTCGGGMPMVVGEELRDLAPSAFVESNVRSMRHTFNFHDPVLGDVNPPGNERTIELWMVQRALFDYALAQRAARMGAELRDGARLREIVTDGLSVTVKVETADGRGELLTSRHLVGADGANGIVARAAGLRRNRVVALGMEVEHPHRWDPEHPWLRPDVLHLDYGVVPQGYAWIFPKAEHLNVGAGMFRPRGVGVQHGLKEELERAIFSYLDSVGAPYDPDAMVFHAHPLPLWNGKEPLNTRDGRILLAGDAAGMINPLFGDGILHAIRSGLLAARVVADGRAASYTRRIHAEIAPNFEAARRLSKPFYQFAGLIYRRLIGRPTATRAAARLLCGDDLFTDASRRAYRLVGKALPRFPRPIPASDSHNGKSG